MYQKYWIILSILCSTLNLGSTVDSNYLTPKEKELIIKTWENVSKDPVTNGMALLHLFLKKYPKYLELYSFRDTPIDKLAENEEARLHVTKVVRAFSKIVNSIHDTELLLEMANKLGAKYTTRGVDENAFMDLKETMLELFSSTYSKEEMTAWTKFLNFLFDEILKGLKQKAKN